MTQFKKGDRVRITLEATVKAVDIETRIAVEDDSGYKNYFNPAVDHSQIELIEPAYEEGAMYVDADGDYFVYWPGLNDDDRPWFEPGREEGSARSYPTLPLVKLVREDA